MNANVTIPLPLARKLLGMFFRLDVPEYVALERAIKRANRALVPGRWCGVRAPADPEWSRREWSPDVLAAEVEGRDGWAGFQVPYPTGWKAWAPDGTVLASGPETGREGRRLADAALAKWARAQGWRP